VATIALDVGGTNVEGGLVCPDGRVICVTAVGSPADEPADVVVASLVSLINAIRNDAENYGIVPSSCGIGIPAPFEYGSGVSQMEHKFRSIKGLALGSTLTDATGMPVTFVNDADALGIGVAAGMGEPGERLIVVGIGTGLGGAFLDGGTIVDSAPGVPEGGEIWNLPYRDGILEDYVSKRAVIANYASQGSPTLDVREIAEQARLGNRKARAAFEQMGTDLGAGLAPLVDAFTPDRVIVAGRIGRAMDLFGGHAESASARACRHHAQWTQSTVARAALVGAAISATRGPAQP
jgi:glucokinase